MDAEYYRNRAETERQRAEEAECPSARAAHADLARRYEALFAEEPNRP